MTRMALLFIGIGIAVRNRGGFVGIITIGFSPVGSVLFMIVLFVLFKSKSFAIDQHTTVVRWRMLGFSGRRTIERDTITAVRYRITSQINQTPYHDVRLELADGSSATVAGGLKTADAQWVANEIAGNLGLEVRPDIREPGR